MSHHYDYALLLVPKSLQSTLDQPLTDTPPLILRKHRHRCQCDGGYMPRFGFNPHAAEEDVAHDASFRFSDKGEQRVTTGPQLVNEISLFQTSEGKFVDHTNGLALSDTS